MIRVKLFGAAEVRNRELKKSIKGGGVHVSLTDKFIFKIIKGEGQKGIEEKSNKRIELNVINI